MKIKTRTRQSLMAKQLGVTQATISLWLNLKVRPRGLPKEALKQNFPDIFKQIEDHWNE